MSKLVLAQKYIDMNCFRWIMNYRMANKIKCEQEQLRLISEIDGHSGGSWAWTAAQSKIIDVYGIEEWAKTKYSNGYLSSDIKHDKESPTN